MYPPTHMLGARRNGLNHVSMNLSTFNRISGPVSGTDYPLYSETLLDWYAFKGVKSVRLMFTWEASNRRSGGPFRQPDQATATTGPTSLA